MSDKFTLIVEHRDLHNVANLIRVAPKHVDQIIAIDAHQYYGGRINSVLDWDEKHQCYTGKTRVGNPQLKGIRNLHIPCISVFPSSGTVSLTFSIDGCQFTQTGNNLHHDYHKQHKGLCQNFLEVIGKRVDMASQSYNGLPVLKHDYMSLEHLSKLLKKGTVVEQSHLSRKKTWEVISTVVLEELPTIDEVRYDGLLVKKTTSWFNGGHQKEEVEYYSIEASGRFTVHCGTKPNFAIHDRVGYIALAPVK